MATAPAKSDAPKGEEVDIPFTSLVPQGSAKSSRPHLKTLDGQVISIADVEADPDNPKGFLVVLRDGSKYGVPPTIAKKVATALTNAKAAKEQGKGTGRTGGTVKSMDRGVRIV